MVQLLLKYHYKQDTQGIWCMDTRQDYIQFHFEILTLLMCNASYILAGMSQIKCICKRELHDI